ncbi:MAG: hypothetical protein ACRED5_13140 [Propylenella sp.]
MFKKTAIAAALVTAIAAPLAPANATGFGFHFSTPHGHFSFGEPGYSGGGYGGMSCYEARNYLHGHFAKVWKIECHGQVYTFKVKNWGPSKIVKINRYTGNYWFA